MAEAGLKETRDGPALAGAAWSVGRGGVESVKDKEVAFGIVHRGKGGDATEMIEGGESVHLIVVDLIPGDVPARLVGANADGEIHGAEVVADAGKAGHEGEVGAADGEDEWVMGVVGGDDIVDLRGSVGEGVLRGAGVVEGLVGIEDNDDGECGYGEANGEMMQRRDDTLVTPDALEDDGDQESERNGED